MTLKVLIFISLLICNKLYSQIGIKEKDVKPRTIPSFFVSCGYSIQNASKEQQEQQNDCCLKSFGIRDGLNILIKLTDYNQVLPIKKGKLSIKIYYGVSNSTSYCNWCDYNLSQNNMSYSKDTIITKNFNTTAFKKAKIFNIYKGDYDIVNELEFNEIQLPYKYHSDYFREQNLFINRIYIEVKVRGFGHKAITYRHIIPVEVTH